MYKKFIFIFIGILFISGCLVKSPIINSYSIKMTIISPEFKIAGTGFYREGDNHLNVQLYSAGAQALNIEIKNMICINDSCVFKGTFNENFFKNKHYSTMLEDILTAKPIYKKENLIKEDNGFSQHIYKKDSFNITYKVDDKTTSFHDIKNGISITIIKLGS